jgi:hypothetical protein
VQKSEVGQLEVAITEVVASVLAKTCARSRKNAEYLVKKKAYELVKGMLASAEGTLYV